MGLFGKLFGKEKAAIAEMEMPPCPHTALAAQWDRLEDMGKQDRVTRYVCTACQATFTREEAEAALLV